MADKNAKIHVPPKGTRGARAIEVVGNLMRPLADREVARYQKLPGPEAGNFMGFPFQVLTTVGAESGKQRNTVLGAHAPAAVRDREAGCQS
jgi:hypothetical protein